jgi:hypothetical protein
LRHELLLGLLRIEHTRLLIHLTLHLTRLGVHIHLLLVLTVQNLHAFVLGHPAIVAVLSEGEVLVEAALAGPVSDLSLLLVTIGLSLVASVVESMVVLLEFNDSISSGDSKSLTIFSFDDVTNLWSSFLFHSSSLSLGDVDIFRDDSNLLTLVAVLSNFAIEVLAARAFPSDDGVLW